MAIKFEDAIGRVISSHSIDPKLKKVIVEKVVSGRVSNDRGAGRNLSANIGESAVDAETLSQVLAINEENGKLKRLLAEAGQNHLVEVGKLNMEIGDLRGQLKAVTADRDRCLALIPASDAKPWEAEGVSKATYYNRRRKLEGKL